MLTSLFRSVYRPIPFQRILCASFSSPSQTEPRRKMELQKVLKALQEIAPTQLAEEWDNVGLLIDAHEPKPVSKIFLTIDLTERVMDEALAEKADFVIAYHPLLFRPIKKISARDPSGRTLLRLMSNKIPLYSPHTAADAISGGINDWISNVLTEDSVAVSRKAIVDNREKHPLAATLPLTSVVGMGRTTTLQNPIPLGEMIRRVKKLTGLPNLRLAAGSEGIDKSITTFAVCAGAGGSLLPKCRDKIDVYITGEMSHHDVLAANAKGTAVILTEHTNTERGWLPIYQKMIKEALQESVDVVVSRTDVDPLVIV